MALPAGGQITHSMIMAEFTVAPGAWRLSQDGGLILQGLGDPKGPGDQIKESDFYNLTSVVNEYILWDRSTMNANVVRMHNGSGNPADAGQPNTGPTNNIIPVGNYYTNAGVHWQSVQTGFEFGFNLSANRNGAGPWMGGPIVGGPFATNGAAGVPRGSFDQTINADPSTNMTGKTSMDVATAVNGNLGVPTTSNLFLDMTFRTQGNYNITGGVTHQFYTNDANNFLASDNGYWGPAVTPGYETQDGSNFVWHFGEGRGVTWSDIYNGPVVNNFAGISGGPANARKLVGKFEVQQLTGVGGLNHTINRVRLK